MTSNTKWNSPHDVDYIFKLLFLGPPSVGKTSIIRRFAHDWFTEHHTTTIGVDVALKHVELEGLGKVGLQMWDVVGQDRYKNSIQSLYYRNALGSAFVFDASRPETLNDIIDWKKELDERASLKIHQSDDAVGDQNCEGESSSLKLPAVILANKCDILGQDDGIKLFATLDSFCEKHGFLGWYATSARLNMGIREALVDGLLNRGILPISEKEPSLLTEIKNSRKIVCDFDLNDDDLHTSKLSMLRCGMSETSFCGC